MNCFGCGRQTQLVCTVCSEPFCTPNGCADAGRWHPCTEVKRGDDVNAWMLWTIGPPVTEYMITELPIGRMVE